MADQNSSQESKNTSINQNDGSGSGKSGFIILVVLILLAVLAYLGVQIYQKDVPEKLAKTAQIEQDNQKEQRSDQEQTSEAAQAQNKEVEIKPGNPVVVRFKGKAITRKEVFDFADKYMSNVAKQLPKEKVFPIAVSQLVNQRLLLSEALESGVQDDPEVVEEIERAKNNILRTAYLQNKIDDRLTEKKLQEFYKEQTKDFEGGKEIKARHILVETKEEAQKIIDKLDQGADFVGLAKEQSTGPSGSQGGDLGYFSKGRMVPEFEEAAFALEKGAYTKEPVKTNFGWHVILVEDIREVEPPKFSEIKDRLKNQLTRSEVQDIISDIRSQSDVEIYNINGEPKDSVGKSESEEAKPESDGKEQSEKDSAQ